MRGRAQVGGGLSAALVVLLALLAPSIASASSSGAIARSQVSADWALASLAGIATRTNDCEEPPAGGPAPPEEPGGGPGGPDELAEPIQPETAPWECGWIAYATVGPGTAQADCSSPGRRWGSIGNGVQLVWSSEELTEAGSVDFDLGNVGLTYGANAPLLCLAAVKAVFEEVMCEGEEPSCPPYVVEHRVDQLDSAILEPETPASSPSQAPILPAYAPNQTNQLERLRKCRIVKQKRRGGNPSRRGAHVSRARVAPPKASQSKLCLSPYVPARQLRRNRT